MILYAVCLCSIISFCFNTWILVFDRDAGMLWVEFEIQEFEHFELGYHEQNWPIV